MAEQYANNAQTTLTANMDTTRPNTFSVTSAAAFPASAQFRILIGGEILVVTSRSGNSLTATTDETSVVTTHTAGATVTHILTAKGLTTGMDDRVGAHVALPDAHHAKTHGHANSGDGGVLATYAGTVLVPVSVPGDLVVTASQPDLPRIYVPPSSVGSSNWQLYAMRANVVVASAGAGIWVDILKNDTSIFTAGGQHDTDLLKLSAGSRSSANWRTATGLPLACTSADYFTVAIQQVGSSTAGTDLTVELVFSKVV